MRIESDSKPISNKSDKENKDFAAKNKKQTLLMFVSIFFVLLLIFLGFAKLMSPDVDITIGDDNVSTELDANNSDYGRAGMIDDRLRALQEEDDGNISISEDDGLVKVPEKRNKDEDKLSKEDSIPLREEQPEKVQTAAPTPEQPNATQSSTITARVVVGFYNTQNQAEVARGILQDAGLGVTPHIKSMNGGYTLQVGAYSSKESANALANKLLMNNYPARIIVEGN